MWCEFRQPILQFFSWGRPLSSFLSIEMSLCQKKVAMEGLSFLSTVETVYRIDVCSRGNLPYIRIFLYCYLITDPQTTYSLPVCPRENLPYFQIFPKCYPITSCPINGFYCTVGLLSGCACTSMGAIREEAARDERARERERGRRRYTAAGFLPLAVRNTFLQMVFFPPLVEFADAVACSTG